MNKPINKYIRPLLAEKASERWSRQAIECYKNGCMCSKCDIPKLITSQKCQMKQVVLDLVRKLGAPDETERFNNEKWIQ